jgi:glycosyltransferase involved in cell wall biosynthesis
LEIILVNDGSDDGSDEIIKSYLHDKRIKYISQSNHGQGHARNRALDIATGEYIYFIDSDDYIELSTLQNCLTQLKKESICVFGVNTFKDGIKRIDLEYRNDSYDSKVAFKMLLKGELFNYSPCNKIISADIIKNNAIYFPEKRGMEDFLFILKCFYYSKEIYTNEGLYYYYRQTIGSSSKIFNSNKIYNTIEVIYEIEDFYKSINEDKMQKYFINLYFSLIFDTLSLILRYANIEDKKRYLRVFYTKIKAMNIYTKKNVLLLNKINILRFIKFKLYDFKRVF